MTTVAWDGKILAADTLSQDTWGLKDSRNKIFSNPFWFAAGAGDLSCTLKWFKAVENMNLEKVLEAGVPNWHKDDNDPSLILICKKTTMAWKASGGLFIPVSRTFHAIGSGRDYALAAMRCGKTAFQAVEIASEFDINTGGQITWENLS